jgi:hypothetical protein
MEKNTALHPCHPCATLSWREATLGEIAVVKVDIEELRSRLGEYVERARSASKR